VKHDFSEDAINTLEINMEAITVEEAVVVVCAKDGTCSASPMGPCQLCSVNADHRQTLSVEEVTMAIRRLKNGKSVGIDDIQAELLKHGGEETSRKII